MPEELYNSHDYCLLAEEYEALKLEKCKALEADYAISNRELLIKQVEINRLTAENAALREQVRWRKYPEEEPPVDGRYLIYSDGSIHLRYLEDGKFIEYINQEYNVTHWMPLPQPPEA